MMDRRKFLAAFGSVSVFGFTQRLYPASVSKTFTKKDPFVLIAAVQEHFFPKGLKMPDAKAFGATNYLKETMAHHTFDPDVKELIIDGTDRFDRFCDGRFIISSSKEKENFLRSFENEEYGSYWLDHLMSLTLEALLSDPIYDGNKRMSGWNAFDLVSGKPRPKSRYCGV